MLRNHCPASVIPHRILALEIGFDTCKVTISIDRGLRGKVEPTNSSAQLVLSKCFRVQTKLRRDQDR